MTNNDVDYSTNLADWQNHHIEGFARAAIEQGKDGYFNAPLFSHIEGNLWVGGCKDGVRLPDDFEFVVSLYQWEKYALPENAVRFEVEMYDSAFVDEANVAAMADTVNACLSKGKTLVHCQAGLNRSNLVAAYALMQRGSTAREAIDLLRSKRSPMILCNQQFEQWLLEQDGVSK